MIYSARTGANAPIFLDILRLYVPRGTLGCDVTFGKGSFWSRKAYAHVSEHSRFTDLDAGGPCLSDLPYADETMGYHVLDPPYICGAFRPKASQRAQQTYSDFSQRYGNHGGTGYKGVYYHPAVEAIYADGLREAWRVLSPGGVQITKVADEVSNHKQHLTHCYIVEVARQLGFEALDLFVVVRADRPHGKRIKKQEHALKNHSFFLVFKKPRRASNARSAPARIAMRRPAKAVVRGSLILTRRKDAN